MDFIEAPEEREHHEVLEGDLVADSDACERAPTGFLCIPPV